MEVRITPTVPFFKRPFIPILRALFFIYLWVVLISLPASAKSADKKIYVIFRYDDFSAKSPLALEKGLLLRLQKYEMPSTWGVIPFVYATDNYELANQETLPLGDVKFAVLRGGIERGLLDVALHGYSHLSIGKNANGQHTEFQGLSFEKQNEKITQGKQYLERNLNIPIISFIPPWGTYDKNTISNLERSGFKAMSSLKWRGDAFQESLSFVPTTAILPDLKRAVNAARKLPDPQPVIVIVFHPFDFSDYDQDRGLFSLDAFEQALAWIKNQDDIEVTTVSQVATKIPDLNGRHFHNYDNMRRLFYILPVPWKIDYLQSIAGVYLSPIGVRNMNVWLISLTVFIYGLMFLLSFGSAYFFLHRFVTSCSHLGRYFHLWATMPLLIGLMLSFSDQQINHQNLSVAIILLGVYLGLFLRQMQREYNKFL